MCRPAELTQPVGMGRLSPSVACGDDRQPGGSVKPARISFDLRLGAKKARRLAGKILLAPEDEPSAGKRDDEGQENGGTNKPLQSTLPPKLPPLLVQHRRFRLAAGGEIGTRVGT